MWLMEKVGIVQRAEVQRLLSSLLKHSNLLLPLAHLDSLVQLSYDHKNFHILSDQIQKRLINFELTVDHVQKVVKLLIICKYLLLHGPSAYFELFKQLQKVLGKYSKIKIEGILGGNNKQIQQLNKSIKQKASMLIQLVDDTEKLRSERMKSQMLKKAILDKDLRAKASEQMKQSLYSRLEGFLWKMDAAIVQLDSWLDEKVGSLLDPYLVEQYQYEEEDFIEYEEIPSIQPLN